MALATVRKPRVASPARWQSAAQRAVEENIQVRQVNSTGMWVANSGSDSTVAYVLEIVNGVVRSCSCPAGEFGDPCCKHAARYYVDAGLLDPEPEPPAPVASVIVLADPACTRCDGFPWRTLGRSQCPSCHNATPERIAA